MGANRRAAVRARSASESPRPVHIGWPAAPESASRASSRSQSISMRRAATNAGAAEPGRVRRGDTRGSPARSEPARSGSPTLAPSAIHPTAGAIAVGCAPAAPGFNVNLGTPDVRWLGLIAKAIRFQTVGLRSRQGARIRIEGARDRPDLDEPREHVGTPGHRVFALMPRRRRSATASRSSGARWSDWVCQDALIDAAEHHLASRVSSRREQILENRLERRVVHRNKRYRVCGIGLLHRIQRRAAAAWPRSLGACRGTGVDGGSAHDRERTLRGERGAA